LHSESKKQSAIRQFHLGCIPKPFQNWSHNFNSDLKERMKQYIFKISNP